VRKPGPLCVEEARYASIGPFLPVAPRGNPGKKSGGTATPTPGGISPDSVNGGVGGAGASVNGGAGVKLLGTDTEADGHGSANGGGARAGPASTPAERVQAPESSRALAGSGSLRAWQGARRRSSWPSSGGSSRGRSRACAAGSSSCPPARSRLSRHCNLPRSRTLAR